MRFGILAEDASDYEAVRVLIQRFATRANLKPPGTKPAVGKGCAALVRKSPRVIGELERKGCNAFVLVHDLDRTVAGLNDENQLRGRLVQLCPSLGARLHICIPVEELEAWFLACPQVMRFVTGVPGKDVPNPHSIPSPKEYLQKLSRAANKKPRLTVNDNRDLAKMLDLAVCEERCPALRQLGSFVALLA